ncbi:extracellular solute-binding protein [Alicyclobacillus fastidiosus]|uniref:Extracellular solute-binding protein n=1 Tax=Alicyclobacillus fastidiosus TaxID=392011 RepID=A0ABY6ZPK5_9BACL|nr:extracellular solute-binding protein [Alicyclobacillus fastidiosus]WAH44523.1 extracellular solute-binding protein [Alicyclobacillus fastidiosus]GMA64983.1 hypothetical protein GCM10025859_54230 [Alicyclobacillus fastidiosus]
MSQAFNKSHPDIQSTVQFFENDPYKQKIQIAIGTHNPPDIFTGWGGGVLKSYIDAGDVYDLTSDLEIRPGLGKSVSSIRYETGYLEGKVYGIPIRPGVEQFLVSVGPHPE